VYVTAVDLRIVHPGHRHRLRHVPVRGRKVRLAGLTVPSVVSLEVSAIVTSALGWLFSTTVKVAVPPPLPSSSGPSSASP
jgi:hypothetical protein